MSVGYLQDSGGGDSLLTMSREGEVEESSKDCGARSSTKRTTEEEGRLQLLIGSEWIFIVFSSLCGTPHGLGSSEEFLSSRGRREEN